MTSAAGLQVRPKPKPEALLRFADAFISGASKGPWSAARALLLRGALS
jgi:hypothetical protein